jgi:cobyrinic acid a,c-diamide synthase
VLAVIDAAAMAETFGAIAYGLAHYPPGLPMYGVLANRVAGEGHANLTKAGMPAGLRFIGGLARNSDIELPDRHLGLVQAEEIADLEQRLDASAAVLESTELASLPPAVELSAPQAAPAPEPLLAGVRIGVARDRAFSFLYPANLDVLRAMGAKIAFFSPLAATELPSVDSIYLPGGYPELHLEQLSANRTLAQGLQRHIEAGKPVYAECGGMLYLSESLTDARGQHATLAGILPGHAQLHARLQAIGYQSAPLSGGMLRGHAFHHSTLSTSLVPAAYTERSRGSSPGEAIYCEKRLVATYFHGYFPSNPRAAAALFQPSSC